MPPKITYTTQQKKFTNSYQNKTSTVTATVTTKAVAKLKYYNMTGGSSPSGSINPPGWYWGSCPSHHNRGHLIGNALGGPGTESNNLVTLVSGTNHPIMYEYEFLVKQYVLTKKGSQHYSYVVECNYDPNNYTSTFGFPVPGAAGNPFCIFPAPAILIAYLLDDNDNTVSLESLLINYQQTVNKVKLTSAENAMVQNDKLYILNGVFKAYSGGYHAQNTCWSVTHDSSQLLGEAKNYATSLGYDV